MISRWVRTWHGEVLRPFLLFLARLGIRPDTLTIASLIFVIVAGVLFGAGRIEAAAWALLVGSILDGLDGALARAMERSTRLGSFLDSVFDHYGDFAIYLGLLVYFLNQGQRLQVYLIFAAMFGSLVGSQIRSRAGMLGIETKTVGVFTRFERVLVLEAGVFTHLLPIAIWILAIGNNFSALQRLVLILRQAPEADQGKPS